MTDAITSAIQVALDGLSQRQATINSNISNVDTPGYVAKTTDFETNLEKALNGDTSVNVTPQQGESTAPTNTQGNNVDIDNETVNSMQTEMQYEAMIEAMNAKFTILKNSIG
jgi:flagellar basal-body rod protein FlgB